MVLVHLTQRTSTVLVLRHKGQNCKTVSSDLNESLASVRSHITPRIDDITSRKQRKKSMKLLHANGQRLIRPFSKDTHLRSALEGVAESRITTPLEFRVMWQTDRDQTSG